MIGATMIESEQRGPATVRSTVELLNAAYALHPAFGEAEIVELGADLRPTFPDNLPRVRRQGRIVARQRPLSPRLPAGARAGAAGRRHIVNSTDSWRRPMRIFLNDDVRMTSRPRTLAAALEALGYGGRKIATAVNGRFVAAPARPHDQADRRRPDRGRGADAGRLRCRSTASSSPRACCSGRRAIRRRRSWSKRSRRRRPRS